MEVRFERLTKRFGDVIAVNDVTMEIASGEFVALLGPSGCGKTTTLLMTAGIYKPSDGSIFFGERVMNRVPPKERNIGMVFQSYALYPHMTVYENLIFPMRLKKMPKNAMQERAVRVANMMGIKPLLDRRPGQLSGGQQQRVALGRALVKEPDLLLFDEPLSNLDARLRLSMRGEIKRLQMDLGITSIYVTHDQLEAMTMADRIAVIQGGALEAYCTPQELYDRPQTLFIAGFVGNPPMNFVDLDLVHENGATYARAEGINLILPADKAEKTTGRQSVTLGIRPEDVHAVAADAAPMLRGEVYVVEPLGRDDLIDVRVQGQEIRTLADPALRLTIGDPIGLALNMDKIQLFDPQTKRSLLWT